ncbi:MAG: TonB-dependent receptor [Acidobacteria bacterium]|nr:TonB-dependent receptor [Acidobacteriota bacterium]
MTRLKIELYLSIAILLVGSALAQQITGSIRGTANDPSGAIVRDAIVTATQVETSRTRTAVTDHDGNYVILELPVGHYRIEVAAKGFQKYVQEGISLSVNETLSVPVRLAVGSETEKVVVTADAQLIQQTVTSLGKTVLQQELLDLPLNGRDFSTLGLLQPGVVPLTPGLREAGGILRGKQGYAVNGQRPESNNFLIDGASNFNGVDAGFVLQPPVDAIAEFRILTHSANAEFGHSTGSTTNIITKSGSNRFHGALWEFLRNDAFDATNFFATSAEPLKQNQFGASIGGPIRKDKTFFYGYYEGFRNRQGVTQGSTVPSLAERQGDFSQLCPEDVGFDPESGICRNFNPEQGDLGGQLVNLFSFTPYPFNQFTDYNPDSQFLQNLLGLFPEPNSGTNTDNFTVTRRDDSNQFGIRVDHYLSPKDTLNFRYSFNDGTAFDPLSPSGASVPGFPIGETFRAQNFVTTETHTFSPSMIGVFRFSFLRNKFLHGERTNHTTPGDLGFGYDPSLEAAVGPPFIQVNGYTTVGDPITGPRNTYQNTFDYSGALTWIRGRHEIKFGGGYQRAQINVLQGIATNGFFVVAGFPISDPFASLLFQQPVFFLQGRGDFGRGIRGNAFNFYGQDTFRLSSRLTLNLGVRYEVPSPYTEIHNRQSLWVPDAQSKVFPNAPAGLLYPGDPGVPAGLIPTFRKGFAPRVGFAWDPTGASKWLVTSSYGIFYEPYYTGQGGPLQAPISAPPYLQTAQINLPNFQNPFAPDGPPPPGTFVTPMTNLTLARNLPLPYAQDWDLNIQRSFGNDFLVEVGYVGTKGTKLPRFVEGNPAVFIPGESSPNNVDQRRLHSGCGLEDPESDCVYASTGLITGNTNSSYNALQASARKRFSHGVSFLASYTYSKSIDYASSFNMTGSASKPVAGENDLAQDPFNLAAERGRSLFDSRHRFVLSYEWSLPFWQKSHNWYQYAFGAWQVNGIFTAMSGTPFTVFDSNDYSLQGGAPEITGFTANRPNLVGNPNAGPKTTTEWFNIDAFAKVTDPGTFGTAGRNIVQGPRYTNWDFSAFKNFKIKESKEFQFRAEFFNVLNHPNFRIPDSDISSPTFGNIQAAQSQRVIQLALKFLY